MTEELEGRNRCVGCGAPSPPTETNYSLISARFGWRLTRTVDGDGNRVMEWRCPECWARWKAINEETARTRK